MKTMVFAIFILSFAQGAFADIIDWDRTGIDAEGIVSRVFLNIRSDGSALLSTSSKTGKCSPEAGHYRGVVAAAELATLAKFARKVIAEQKPLQSRLSRESRQIMTALSVQSDSGEMERAHMVNANQHWREFEMKVNAVIEKLSPVSAVAMSVVAQANEQDLRLRFEFRGKVPFKMILPEVADQGFRWGDGSLRYLHHPKQTEINLSQKNPFFEIVLTQSHQGRGLVHYSNSVYLHHQSPPDGLLDEQAQLVQLCTEKN